MTAPTDEAAKQCAMHYLPLPCSHCERPSILRRKWMEDNAPAILAALRAAQEWHRLYNLQPYDINAAIEQDVELDAALARLGPIPGGGEMKCQTCDSDAVFSWTDTHGIAQCFTCGTPYRLYHYDENNKRIDKPPEFVPRDEWKPLLREYWTLTHKVIPSGCSFPGGQELANRDDHESFSRWCTLNESRLPIPEEGNETRG